MNGIICLQETYSAPGGLELWTKEWGGDIHINNETTHSKGVAILIPKNMVYDIKTIKKDNNGRYILLSGTFNTHDLTLLNVYSPTGDKVKEQVQFLESITEYINEYNNNLIIAGDLNTYLTEIDKHGKVKKKSEYAKKINNIIDDTDMVDVWRLLNPTTKRYTWRKMSINGIKQSRLDYIIIPKSFLNNIETIEIKHNIYSDHNPVHLKIKPTQSSSKGRGFWKFNTSLLKDIDYVTKVNSLIETEIKENRGTN
jgi:exonuclease III